MSDNAKPKSWKYKVIEATRGNQTLMGSVLIAILAPFSITHPPRFSTDGANIDKEGMIYAKFQHRNGTWHTKYIFHAKQLGEELNRVADQCKLHDHERLALFSEAQKWIVRDHRTNKTALERLQ